MLDILLYLLRGKSDPDHIHGLAVPSSRRVGRERRDAGKFRPRRRRAS